MCLLPLYNAADITQLLHCELDDQQLIPSENIMYTMLSYTNKQNSKNFFFNTAM